ncbi:uncharacterized protein LOC102809817 [Saccoglossus kowalevskii]|uniref:Protein shisa-5-like n=1 Tax=Saccoglossus kowalevskii TaxID=10224 RepID=A0ABM0LWT0_SACKO|nr:PREDICTED: protein shisa-5-like [Saccoglossus kowalevskii]
MTNILFVAMVCILVVVKEAKNDRCTGYVDILGNQKNGFDCPSIIQDDWDDDKYCCGTYNYKYCCDYITWLTAKFQDDDVILPSPMSSIMVGILIGVLIIVVVVIIVIIMCASSTKRSQKRKRVDIITSPSAKPPAYTATITYTPVSQPEPPSYSPCKQPCNAAYIQPKRTTRHSYFTNQTSSNDTSYPGQSDIIIEEMN